MSARQRLFCLLPGLIAACHPDPFGVQFADVAVPLPLPVLCEQVPTDLRAEAWQSGARSSTPLEVDLVTQETRGTVEVTAGLVRRLVVDWYVERRFEGEPVRVLLAQYATEIDLTMPDAAVVSWPIDATEMTSTDCVDVRSDLSREGVTQQTVGGIARPVCDLDESCTTGGGGPCTNLEELCAGTDPFVQ